jgi:putative FmdB family regulatory protein
MAKYKYEYRCPKCGTQLEFKMRVTQTKRKCPHCGEPITPEEIDRQAAKQFVLKCIGLVVTAVLVIGICGGICGGCLLK